MLIGELALQMRISLRSFSKLLLFTRLTTLVSCISAHKTTNGNLLNILSTLALIRSQISFPVFSDSHILDVEVVKISKKGIDTFYAAKSLPQLPNICVSK